MEAPPHPLIGQLSALHHFRIYADIGVVVVVLALTNLIAHFTTPWANVATVPAAAVGLLSARPVPRRGLVRVGARARALEAPASGTRSRRSGWWAR